MLNCKTSHIVTVVISTAITTIFTVVPGYSKHLRNNDVRFVSKTSHGFDSVAFIENDHCVTSGQPYKGVSTYKYMSIRVKAGRKNASYPKSCFKNWVAADNYGRLPDSLHFVVKGTLILKKRGCSVATLHEIVLAQGHAINSNNWWVGGANCIHPKNSFKKRRYNELHCYDKNQQWCLKRSSTTDNMFYVWKGVCEK
ncbi:MAG: hypothetical protein OXD32_04920 [Endozoicomonadaceae bacterium]|nr:hypothetical protein [Endozoicomonadaceae bacterium]MCY4330418.1 hypothetical protein [Endozoicomonadaceae bacterium]